jgi:hypothetical protein
MLTQPNEPSGAMRRPIHSKAYQRWMALLFILLTAGVTFAIFYVLSIFVP